MEEISNSNNDIMINEVKEKNECGVDDNHQEENIDKEEMDDNDENMDDDDGANDDDNGLLPSGDDWQEGNETNLSCIRDCYCVNCELNHGITTMLPTKVPYFREIIIMSFQCPDCYYQNTEINFGGEIQEKGNRIVFTITDPFVDLNRQIIKSDSATVTIPHCYELEIPPRTQRGTITTIEGFLKSAANNIQSLQSERLKLGDIDNFHRCRLVIEKLNVYANGGNKVINEEDEDKDESSGEKKVHDANEDDEDVVDIGFEPFTIVIDDPAGNSYIENIYAPVKDPNMNTTYYIRTPTQDMSLGLQPSADAIKAGMIDDTNPLHKNIVNTGGLITTTSTTTTPTPTVTITNQTKITTGDSSTNDIDIPRKKQILNHTTSTTTTEDNMNDNDKIGREEGIIFQTPCPHCFRIVETNMCVVDIPHFKEVIIMSLVCETCGYKSNEIKGGGGIPKFGTEIVVTITTSDDLQREILKSDTAGIMIPEVDLELSEGGLDGVYTTIEGLLNKMHDRLLMANPFSSGDSAMKQHADNDMGNVYSTPNPTHTRYREFLMKLKDMANGIRYPFTLIITDPLSNSFVGPIPKDAITLALQAENDGNHLCYDTYIDTNMIIREYERTFEQNEILGLNDMKTENYTTTNNNNITTTTTTTTTTTNHTTGTANDDDNDNNNTMNDTTESSTAGVVTKDDDDVDVNKYYGTDTMVDVPDRIRRIDIRGPDHPHNVGKAPVENDTTIMGPGSTNFAVPSIGQRNTQNTSTTTNDPSNDHGIIQQQGTTTTTTAVTTTPPQTTLKQQLYQYEKKDENFIMAQEYTGSISGMVYKDGAQGIGYYTDNVPLHERC